MQLSALYRYPIKSCAAQAGEAFEVEPRGLAEDRRWMVVDADGRFLTGRQHGRLALLQAVPQAGGLSLRAPGESSGVFVPEPSPDAPRRDVVVWRDAVQALVAGAVADAWLSAFLGQPVRLVFMDAAARRPVDPDFAQVGDEVGFADGFPFLLISQASLDGLNARLATAVSMLQFRPNLVVQGGVPHIEDGWRRIRIGDVAFDVVKPCTRCVFTTVDPVSGERDPSGEPLRTLMTYRRMGKGICFGQNLIARGTGTLRVGDPVSVLEHR